MSTADPGIYRYTIDRSDALRGVDDAWLGFARDNEAAELTRAHVLGRPLWQFIAGAETSRIYALLLSRVRDRGAPVSVPFRCDSPDRFRFMRLDLSAAEDGGVALAGVLVREQARPHYPLLDRLCTRSRYAFPICSFCRRIYAFGEWLEAEQAVARLGLLESEHPPAIEEEVCASCSSECRTLAAVGVS